MISVYIVFAIFFLKDNLAWNYFLAFASIGSRAYRAPAAYRRRKLLGTPVPCNLSNAILKMNIGQCQILDRKLMIFLIIQHVKRLIILRDTSH